MVKQIIVLMLLWLFATGVQADFMDGHWAQKLCKSWNKTDALYNQLGSKWAKNTNKRGFRLIQMYRSKCNAGSRIQLTIEPKYGRAVCTYGGNVDGTPVDLTVDYVFSADNDSWQCIGRGELGCRLGGALATGKLHMLGDRQQAMANIASFNALLKATNIKDDDRSCDYDNVIPPKPVPPKSTNKPLNK